MIDSVFIETILIKNGRVRNIKYHNQRCNTTRMHFFNDTSPINLRAYIDTTKAISPVVKCRITYSQQILNVEYEAYHLRPIRSLKLIEANIDYSHKKADRAEINTLFEQRGIADDILIIKNGYLTDTSYGNIALLKNGKWMTPKVPLLSGTRRALLLKKSIIHAENLMVSDILPMTKIMIFNAMIPFGKMVVTGSEVF